MFWGNRATSNGDVGLDSRSQRVSLELGVDADERDRFLLLLADDEPPSHELRQLLCPPPQRRDPEAAPDLDDDEASGSWGPIKFNFFLLSFGLKKDLRFHFDSMTCRN